MTTWQKIAVIMVFFFILYTLYFILRFWYADTRFNKGYQYSRAGYYKEAYQFFHEAIDLNPNEPFYRDELSFPTAALAVAASQQNQADLANQLTKEAIGQNSQALNISPSNVNFWKTRTKIFYTLATIKGLSQEQSNTYNETALNSLLSAQKLAPTDPKITYNLGLIYGKVNNTQMAIKTLEEAVKLKSNYRDARFALALYYHETGKPQEAILQLQYILEKIASDAGDAKEKLKEWGQ